MIVAQSRHKRLIQGENTKIIDGARCQKEWDDIGRNGTRTKGMS